MQRCIWSVLKRNRVGSVYELADLFLGRLEGLSVHEQLRQQRVANIYIRPLLTMGAIQYSWVDRARLNILLAEDLEVHAACITLGHELAHSFAFRVSQNRTLERFWPKSRLAEEEEFAEIFGTQWGVAGNNHEETVALLNTAQRISPRWRAIRI